MCMSISVGDVKFIILITWRQTSVLLLASLIGFFRQLAWFFQMLGERFLSSFHSNSMTIPVEKIATCHVISNDNNLNFTQVSNSPNTLLFIHYHRLIIIQLWLYIESIFSVISPAVRIVPGQKNFPYPHRRRPSLNPRCTRQGTQRRRGSTRSTTSRFCGRWAQGCLDVSI